MGRSAIGGKKIGLFALSLLVLVALGMGAWFERTRLLAWYYVHQLSGADDASRAAWVERVSGLVDEALPLLLRCLTQPEERTCANAQVALACLIERCGPDDERRSALAGQLADCFPHMSGPGQQSALELGSMLRSTIPPPGIARLLAEAAKISDKEVR